MENPNEDTQWNDILRQKGILPPKQAEEKVFTEDEIVNIVESTVKERNNGKSLDELTLDELDLLEDEEDERVILEYRNKRMMEMKEISKAAKYGEVREISAVDYVDEVNKAGDGVWVVLHLYKQGIPLCTLINQHLQSLALKFPATKFLKSISNTCIPNYPDRNLPTIFVYLEGNMKQQIVGALMFGGMKLTQDALEWMLFKAGAVKSTLEADPRPQIKDVLMSSLKSSNADGGSEDENDW